MTFAFILLGLFACLALGVVKGGFQGSLTLNIASGGAKALGIKRGTMRQNIQNIKTNSTASTLVAGAYLPNVRIQTTYEHHLSFNAQYSAGGAGDPIAIGSNAEFGNIVVAFQAGDSFAGNFMFEEIENSLDVDGSIDYAGNMISNGAVTRTVGS